MRAAHCAAPPAENNRRSNEVRAATGAHARMRAAHCAAPSAEGNRRSNEVRAATGAQRRGRMSQRDARGAACRALCIATAPAAQSLPASSRVRCSASVDVDERTVDGCARAVVDVLDLPAGGPVAEVRCHPQLCTVALAFLRWGYLVERPVPARWGAPSSDGFTAPPGRPWPDRAIVHPGSQPVQVPWGARVARGPWHGEGWLVAHPAPSRRATGHLSRLHSPAGARFRRPVSPCGRAPGCGAAPSRPGPRRRRARSRRRTPPGASGCPRRRGGRRARRPTR